MDCRFGIDGLPRSKLGGLFFLGSRALHGVGPVMLKQKENDPIYSRLAPRASLLGLLCALLAGNSVAGEQQAQPVIVTLRNTCVYSYDNGKLRVAGNIPACSVLETASGRFETPNCNICNEYWRVQSPFSNQGLRWGYVPRRHAFDLNKMRQRVLKGLPENFDPQQYQNNQNIPKLILLSDSRMVEAWKELVPVIEWNKNQLPTKRLPGPFFKQPSFLSHHRKK